MASLAVECLRCHASRIARLDRFGHFEAPECPACGYLGWTPLREPSEREPRSAGGRRPAGRRLPSLA